ncbi:hypothetical protein NQ176_g11300 [Zarea fungicola]|uniref:Uncharacterized protein n=1 Tax=Zarea fungicola TaxID=93591 RepID=A0ACC1MBH6_9HYPO|nr:hypothetical protein NQ176_g11300 [Lecanicillium fungicola]
MPYQGVSGSMLASTVLDPNNAWIALSGDKDSNPVTANQTFTLPKQGAGGDNGQLPALCRGVPGAFLNNGGWDGSLNDGSYAPAGKYRLIVRALRVFGNPNKDSDWDTAISPGFKIKYST